MGGSREQHTRGGRARLVRLHERGRRANKARAVLSCCRKLRPVDISAALAALPSVTFADTGGSNGHIAFPAWLDAFVAGLGLSEVVYAVVRKLPAYQGIPAHIDEPHARNGRRRFHVPLVTDPRVFMRWPNDGVAVHLEAGWLYEVDALRLHEIVHRAPVERIHVQVNTWR